MRRPEYWFPLCWSTSSFGKSSKTLIEEQFRTEVERFDFAKVIFVDRDHPSPLLWKRCSSSLCFRRARVCLIFDLIFIGRTNIKAFFFDELPYHLLSKARPLLLPLVHTVVLCLYLTINRVYKLLLNCLIINQIYFHLIYVHDRARPCIG